MGDGPFFLMAGALAIAGASRSLIDGSAAGAASAAVNAFSAIPAARTPAFHSRPDLRLPGLAVDVDTGATAPGLIFLAPYGG